MMKTKHLFMPFALGLGLALVWVLGGMGMPATGAPRAEGYVEAPKAPTAELHVCPSGCAYSSIQDAVDAAADGDVIKVATGTYTDVNSRPAPRGYVRAPAGDLITQVVYISKTVTVCGGFTADNWTTSNPEDNPTTLDAMGRGRVVYITGDISPRIEGLRITGGDALGLEGRYSTDAGGGVYVVTATAAIFDNQVFGNVSECGGGLYLQRSTATLNGNIITGNTASSGGGLYLHEGATIVGDNVIMDNTAFQGGGVSLEDSYDIVSGNIIADNTAIWGAHESGARGGGVYLVAGNATLSGNTISGNVAGGGYGRGGGLFLRVGHATLDGNTITKNIAGDGGGLYLFGESQTTLINNEVTDNYASGSGSGLYLSGSSSRMSHNTIARNSTFGGSGDGSGLYATYGLFSASTTIMTNTILVSHSVGISVTDEYNTVIINGILWHNTPVTVIQSATSFVTAQNQYTGDPAFVDFGNGDYHIGPGSAAIDTGVDAGVDYDMDGDPRPLGSGYDLGADEAGLVVTKQAYPDPVQPGAPLTYTIYITNATGVELHATITDTLPGHITLARTSAGMSVSPGGMVTWTQVSILPQEVWRDRVVVTVEVDHTGPLTNTVEVITEEGATGRYVHILAPDLKVAKLAKPDPVRPGEQLMYTIYVTNTGNFDLHATVTDAMPVSATLGGAPSGTVILPDGTWGITWTTEITAPNDVWTETVVVTVAKDYEGPLTNLVEVTTEEGAVGRAIAIVNAHKVYLPLVLRNFP